MKLLIVTQVVDLDHPILGFFHRWIEEFATHCESVEVICLQAGRHSLPANVTVHSLGKELGSDRLQYVWRWYRYIWQLRHQYDAVFVHMNQIYVLLGWLVWRVLGKRVGLWYMHGSTPLSLKIASRLTDHIYTGSPESFRLERRQVLVTGHGIDTDTFAPQPNTPQFHDLITVGRISPSKNLHTLLDVLYALPSERTLTICGRAVTPSEQTYEAELQQQIRDLGLSDRVQWYGQVSRDQLPNVLRASTVFVTTAQNGSLDKAVLEAMACGLPVVSMAPGTRSLDLGKYQVDSVKAMILQLMSDIPYDVREYNRQQVVTKHSLATLVSAKIIPTLV